jgi:hypothetical protein
VLFPSSQATLVAAVANVIAPRATPHVIARGETVVACILFANCAQKRHLLFVERRNELFHPRCGVILVLFQKFMKQYCCTAADNIIGMSTSAQYRAGQAQETSNAKTHNTEVGRNEDAQHVDSNAIPHWRPAQTARVYLT